MLTDASIDTLKDLCSMDAQPGELAPVPTPAFTGTIPLGHDLRGVVMIRVSREMGLACLQSMMPAETADEHALRDAVGEVANVIAGSLIQRLAGIGLEVEIGVPLVSHEEPTIARAEGRAEGRVERVHLRVSSPGQAHPVTVFCSYDRPVAGDKGVRGR